MRVKRQILQMQEIVRLIRGKDLNYMNFISNFLQNKIIPKSFSFWDREEKRKISLVKKILDFYD